MSRGPTYFITQIRAMMSHLLYHRGHGSFSLLADVRPPPHRRAGSFNFYSESTSMCFISVFIVVFASIISTPLLTDEP